ncbi:Bystin, putative isoform 3 [Hibiscus syriacus]|uniref:Bystin, putative isoform 3 n=1 Tax=Hibiscus syriacus TaxID=106335 RepID=A0A6A2Z6B1_HIBSY|nr:Bystin, putative isoform 3 [Hibiscus syriacus]
MAKNKRERNQNPQPFLADDDSVASRRKHSKALKHHQKQDKMISSGMSSKILKEALLQQKEIEEEASGGNTETAFRSVEEENNKHEEEEDIDDFGGFSETQSQFGNYDEQIDEDDEKLLEAFLSKDAGPQRTLADVIIQKIKENDEKVASETRPMPKLDDSLIDLYKGVGKFLNKYTAGKMPKAFKHIPSMQLWEDVLYLTQPENWSPNAMFQATRIFASNLGAKKAERFYRLVLLPRVRDDIRKNKRLHFALYQSLKKALYKPAAFNKGILFPLCKSGTCNLREAVIVGSVLEKVSIPMLHSSVALMKLAEMEYCGTTSYFIKLLLEKKYALPYRVVDAVVAHFMRFLEDTRIMPVIWHQSLLAFVQRYKNELRKEDKDNLRILLETQKHKLVTPEIMRELDNSRNRGEVDDPMKMSHRVMCSRNN